LDQHPIPLDIASSDVLSQSYNTPRQLIQHGAINEYLKSCQHIVTHIDHFAATLSGHCTRRKKKKQNIMRNKFLGIYKQERHSYKVTKLELIK